ncbi:hypothetical protein BDW71DRAFT_186358 [Aspergillus fruticulosus]
MVLLQLVNFWLLPVVYVKILAVSCLSNLFSQYGVPSASSLPPKGRDDTMMIDQIQPCSPG